MIRLDRSKTKWGGVKMGKPVVDVKDLKKVYGKTNDNKF